MGSGASDGPVGRSVSIRQQPLDLTGPFFLCVALFSPVLSLSLAPSPAPSLTPCLWIRLRRAGVQLRVQRVRVEPVPERRHLPRPGRRVPVRLSVGLRRAEMRDPSKLARRHSRREELSVKSLAVVR